jgi:hypothetical protein
MGRPGRLESGRGGSDLSVADKDLLLRASETVHGGLLAPNTPLLTTRDSRREAYCWRRNTRNLQILVVSLSTMLPLSTLSASVSQITELYGSSTYQLVVGLLFLSAFPMALLQVSTLLPMPSYPHKASTCHRQTHICSLDSRSCHHPRVPATSRPLLFSRNTLTARST